MGVPCIHHNSLLRTFRIQYCLSIKSSKHQGFSTIWPQPTWSHYFSLNAWVWPLNIFETSFLDTLVKMPSWRIGGIWRKTLPLCQIQPFLQTTAQVPWKFLTKSDLYNLNNYHLNQSYNSHLCLSLLLLQRTFI